MDSFEVNKIFGALTGALMVFFAVSFTAEEMFGVGHKKHGEHQELAYSLEIEGADDGGEAEEEVEVISLAALLATANPSDGERSFRKCSSCHVAEPGGDHKTGPQLYGILGRDFAGTDFDRYSDTLTGLDGAWDWETLNAFLESPRDWAPGTTMSFAGIRDPEERAAILLWLNAQSDAPLDLPAEGETAALDVSQ